MANIIKTLVVHHSASEFGNVLLIDNWHKHRKPNAFRMIGYHWVILNGRPHSDVKRIFPCLNGTIETGRPLNDDKLLDKDEKGAHAYGHNKDTVGVCLIGNMRFTPEQFISLKMLYDTLIKLGIDVNVKGHNEVSGRDHTSCPHVPMDNVRAIISLDYAKAIRYMMSNEMAKYIAVG